MPDSADLLAQARAMRERHGPYRYESAPDSPECSCCSDIWPCPDRLLADAVVSHLERCDAERAQIRDEAARIRGRLNCRYSPMCSGPRVQDWCNACLNDSAAVAILSLLGPDAARGREPNETTHG